MNNKSARKQPTNNKKWIALSVALVLILVILCGVIAAIVTGTKPQDWFKKADDSKLVVQPSGEDDAAPLSVECYALPAAEGDKSTVRLTAVVKNLDASLQFAWDIAFVNPDSEWATGKTVTDYVTFERISAATVDLHCLQAFGEQIIVTAKVRGGGLNTSKSCLVDYKAKPYKVVPSYYWHTAFKNIVNQDTNIYTWQVQSQDYDAMLETVVAAENLIRAQFESDYTIKYDATEYAFSLKVNPKFIAFLNTSEAVNALQNMIYSSDKTNAEILSELKATVKTQAVDVAMKNNCFYFNNKSLVKLSEFLSAMFPAVTTSSGEIEQVYYEALFKVMDAFNNSATVADQDKYIYSEVLSVVYDGQIYSNEWKINFSFLPRLEIDPPSVEF